MQYRLLRKHQVTRPEESSKIQEKIQRKLKKTALVKLKAIVRIKINIFTSFLMFVKHDTKLSKFAKKMPYPIYTSGKRHVYLVETS